MPGTAGDDDQVRLVKPADLGVEAFEPGGEAGQMAAAVERALGHLERFLGRVGEGLGLALGAAFLGDLVKLGLGALDLSEGGNVLTRVERAFDQVAAYADQRPEQRQIVDLLRKVPRPDHGRARSRQLRQICGAANLFYRFVGFEQRPQGYRVGDPVAVGQLAGSLRRCGRAAARRNGAACSLSWTSSTSRLSIISAPSSAASASTFWGSDWVRRF